MYLLFYYISFFNFLNPFPAKSFNKLSISNPLQKESSMFTHYSNEFIFKYQNTKLNLCIRCKYIYIYNIHLEFTKEDRFVLVIQIIK